jgi:hypothetical protein
MDSLSIKQPKMVSVSVTKVQAVLQEKAMHGSPAVKKVSTYQKRFSGVRLI